MTLSLPLQRRIVAVIRARILAAIVDYYDFDPTDPIDMTEPLELTDRIMAALFKR